MKDLKNYIDDIDNLNSFLLNQDQKKLIKEILVNTNNSNKENLDNVFQLLIQRVKTGFVFDAAPSVDTKQIAILKKQEKLSFTNDLLNTNKNTLIIGENYDALKNLLAIERQKEQIGGGDYNYDLIYIDPPYNTDSAKDDGNNLSEKDNVEASKFIYRDKFSRTGWLNMINERLKMARQLLKEDGVIFVSIDDNEQAYLKVLMDEIFGEENFVACLARITKKGGGRFGNSNIQKDTDFILVYCKNIYKAFKFKKVESDWDDYKFEDAKGPYTLKHPLDGGAGNIKYNFEVELNNKIFKPRNGGNWSFSKERIDWMIKNEIIVENSKGILYVKNYKNLEIKKEGKEYKLCKKDGGIDWSSSKLMDNIYSNYYGTLDLKQIFNCDKFSYPKPKNLIKQIISSCPNPNARVLDFFAGSGTTGHAVLDLNKEDGGNRTFTLVTNNENNIGINVCYERLYRINKGRGSKGETDFDWIKKNEPYNQNLDVFEIKYYDTDALANNNEIIKKDFKNMLNDFNLSNVNKINEQEILLNLTALKPIEGKDSNESN
ncbi:site-specific DNA-methyltransferase [Metamycoplasma hominis]|uniref:site-specific DNA-methyltransferase n=1 Tax=Metamycoplasma hominis TaxID=2098 RepID=UPI003CF73483